MEWLSDRIRGYAVVRVVGAEPARFLEECAGRMIEFWGANPEDEFSFVISMRLGDIGEIDNMAKKSNCEAQIIATRGGPSYMKRLRRRFVLWALPFICAGILILSSFFVWEIEIEGNVAVTDTEILNVLEECGVHIGSFWPSFTSDSIRNLVLAQIPELKWLSVSVFGSRAYVEVRERTQIPEVFAEDEYYKIVADRAGIVEEMNVLRGNRMFETGQTVAAGDVLIDGVVDSTYSGVRFVHASGVVIARTWYEITAILPLEYTEKVYTGDSDNRFSLVVGGSRINFYRNSGILGEMCDNIITEHQLSISGLFTLPVSIVRERSEQYVLQTATHSQEQAYRILEATLNEELLSRIGADGQVQKSEFTMNLIDGCAVGTLRAECLQNIATEVPLTADEMSRAKAMDEMEEQNTE